MIIHHNIPCQLFFAAFYLFSNILCELIALRLICIIAQNHYLINNSDVFGLR